MPRLLQRSLHAEKCKNEFGSLFNSHGPNWIYCLSAGNFTKIMETEKNSRLTHTVHFSTGGRTIRNLVKLQKISLNLGGICVLVRFGVTHHQTHTALGLSASRLPRCRGDDVKGKNKEVIFLWSTFCVEQTIRWHRCLQGELSEPPNAVSQQCFTSFTYFLKSN